MREVLINGRWPLKLPDHRADRPEWLIENGGWEVERLNALHDAVIKFNYDPTVYYIGSELADIPALMATWGCHMVLVEPNTKSWPVAKAIWEGNELPLPTTFQGFASNETKQLGELPIIGGFPQCANGEIITEHGFNQLKHEGDAIPQIRIDDLVMALEDTPVAPPDIITHDTEGSEWEVLRGAEKTIKEHKPLIFSSVHPEFMFEQYGEYSTDFRNWVKGFGYREDLLEYRHELHLSYYPT